MNFFFQIFLGPNFLAVQNIFFLLGKKKWGDVIFFLLKKKGCPTNFVLFGGSIFFFFFFFASTFFFGGVKNNFCRDQKKNLLLSHLKCSVEVQAIPLYEFATKKAKFMFV